MMRNIISKLSAIFFIFAVIICYFIPTQTLAANINLIQNPSFETSSNNLPLNWVKDRWGSNTSTFTYLNSGQDGVKSGYVKITNYVSGDAKWAFASVNVKPSTTYSFSDYYKSTIDSYIVVRFTNTNNVDSYSEIGKAITSADWKQYSKTFTTKAGTAKVSVLHLIRSNGELWTDNYTLTENSPITPTPIITPSITPTQTITPTISPTLTPSITPTNSPTPTPAPTTPPVNSNVPNPSFENSSNNLPVNWTKDKWGNNNATFQYLTSGYTGNKSAQVTISSYTSGDAKWSYDPQPLTKGGYYRFEDYYKSSASTQVAVSYFRADGSQDYFPLPNAPVSSDWKHYSAYFTVPSDAVKVQILHLIDTIGFLNTDDYSVTPATPKSFQRPLLTLTFDDAWENNYTTVLPKLEALGFKSTQCYATQYIEGSGQEFKVKAFVDAGHEICSHSVTHPDLTTVNSTSLDYELQHAQQYLETLAGKGNVTDFAAPFGSYNDKVLTYAQKYYTSYRSTDAGYNSRDDFDYYNVHVQNIENTTTATEVQSWINNAIATKTWLVIVYHDITNTPTQYDTTPTIFSSQLNVIKNSGIAVLTYKQALQEIGPQLDK